MSLEAHAFRRGSSHANANYNGGPIVMAKSETKLIITIKDGQIAVDSVGYEGMNCAEDAINRELKRIGRVLELKKTPSVEERPVTNVNTVGVG